MDVKFFLVFILTLSVVELTEATGSGNGDGGGELLNPQDENTTSGSVPPCRLPVHSDPSRIRPVENDDQLDLEGRCYLACTKAPSIKQTKINIMDSLSPVWPYVRVGNCRISRMVHECTRGCILFHQADQDQADFDCPQECENSCRSECGGQSDWCDNPDHFDPWMRMESPETTCDVGCDIKWCRTGCSMMDLQEELTVDLPHDPSGQPTLDHETTSGRIELYSPDLSRVAPRHEVDDTTRVEPVVFLYKIKAPSHNVSFIWRSSPFVPLDLTDYACQQLQVSFAVVNIAGLSNFSAPTSITVPGDTGLWIPNPPTNIHLWDAIDKRIGYFGHVILNISWDRPEDGAHLDSFAITVTPVVTVNRNCGNEPWSATVSPSTTSVLVMADSRGSLPVMECTYTIQVYGMGADGGSTSLEQRHTMQTFDPDCINFDCERQWHTPEYVFSFILRWTIPDYLRYGHIIESFLVDPRIRDGSGTVDTSQVTPQVEVAYRNPTSQIFTTELTVQDTGRSTLSYYSPKRDPTFKYSIETFINWNRTTALYVPSSYLYQCQLSVVSPAPSSVDDFTVTSYHIVDNRNLITLTMRWSPPTEPNGALGAYNVCVGGEALDFQEEVQPHSRHICGILDGTNITLYFFENICLFVQIRANNQYVPGNWSEPFIISFHPSGLCQVPVPGQVENVTLSSYCVQDNAGVVINLSWVPPDMGFSKVEAHYNVCVSEVKTPVLDALILNEFCRPVEPELTSATLLFPFNESLLASNETYLFLLMRANNIYGSSSDWSEPISLQMDSADECVELQQTNVPTHNSRSKDSAIVGSVLGCLMVLPLLACCVCLTVLSAKMLRRRKRLLRITQEPCDDPMFNSGPRKLLLNGQVGPTLASPQRDDWEIPANEVIIEDSLGEGAFGEVYKGVVKCPIINPKVRSSVKNAFCTPVAIKLLKISAKGSERQDFLAEIEMMKKVAEGQNPHVVCLLGCVTIQEPLCLITEFIKYGDLLSYLRTNRRMYTGSETDERSDSAAYVELGSVSPQDLVSFAYQIASGMEYLASLGIVHRDLACRNILVDEGKVLKITDFGMSRETDEIYVQKRTGRVPLKWMAIESIIAREFTSASDVWSYGITLWEIGTLGGFPYPSIQNEDLLTLLKRGYRLEKPDNCSSDVYDIMLMCWNGEPQNRPKFTELRAKFDAMLLAEKKDVYIDLRIDCDKPYYRLDTMTTLMTNGLQLSPTHSRQSLIPSPSPARDPNQDCSPHRLLTPKLSPCRKSPADGSCSSAQSTPQKSGCSDQVLPPPLNSSDSSPNFNSCECIQTSGDSETREREISREGQRRRPTSMLLPFDRDRRERQNPYVDEPSRAAATALAATPRRQSSCEHVPHTESEGAIEMNNITSREGLDVGIHITITEDCN